MTPAEPINPGIEWEFQHDFEFEIEGKFYLD